jgi:hypothetical protein
LCISRGARDAPDNAAGVRAIGGTFGDPNLTDDGTHWGLGQMTAPQKVGTFTPRDVFLTKIGKWCGY